MWLAISSIVLASAIGFNVLALVVTGWLEKNQPESPPYTQQNTNSDLTRHWAREGNRSPRFADIPP
jgi:hypothetical protein